MRYTHLAFVRGKYSLLHEALYQAQNDPLSTYPDPRRPTPVPAIFSHDVLIRCLSAKPNDDLTFALFGQDGPPSFIECYEVIETGFYSAHAPPEMVWDEYCEDEIEVFRTSESVVRDLLPISESRPARGRKLLIVQFREELDESDVSRADTRIRRALGSARGVWQGKFLRGYCFTHDFRCRDVAEALSDTLGASDVEDFLMVEPLAVPFSSHPLSPLKDWVERDFSRLPKATVPHRRKHRSGQRGS